MYFPKSQIKTNLYTNGNEFIIKGKELSYVGYYFKTSTGKYYVGKAPKRGANIRLFPIDQLSNNIVNNNIDEFEGWGETLAPPNAVTNFWHTPEEIGDADAVVNTDMKYTSKSFVSQYQKNIDTNRLVPPPSPFTLSKLTPQQIRASKINRYYVKDIRNNSYYEISSNTYQNLNNGDEYAKDLFPSTSLLFYLGRTSKVNKINSAQYQKVEVEKKWKGFSNLYQFNAQHLYTDGNEFLLPNRTNYIGFYHQMDNGNFMTGKTHGDGKGIVLIPLKSTPQTSQTTSTSQTSTSNSSTPMGGGGY